MGKKRRGSQAFYFEQSEETLKENETIVNLYQNKTFVPPEPKLYETILEEGNNTPTTARAKRGQVQASKDGSLVLGLNKSSRTISENKYWRQGSKSQEEVDDPATLEWKEEGEVDSSWFVIVNDLVHLFCDRITCSNLSNLVTYPSSYIIRLEF